jgi:integrase
MQARHDTADIFEIGLNTGMRGGETVKLTWPQIDFMGDEIYLGETKNGDSRFVPINSRVKEILIERFGRRTSKYVFPSPDGKKPRYQYAKTFRRIAESLGLAYGLKTGHGFTMHSTRHSAATRMLRKGVDMKTVQEIVGHSNATMTLIYSHATSKSRKSAVEQLVRGVPAKNSTGESA